MRGFYLPILVLLCLISSCESNYLSKQSHQLTAFADPFVGTGGHGHTYPGATVPFECYR